MKWGLLPVSHNALLVGDMAYYDFNGLRWSRKLTDQPAEVPWTHLQGLAQLF